MLVCIMVMGRKKDMAKDDNASGKENPMEQIVRRHFEARFPELEVKQDDKIDKRIKLLAKSVEDNLIAQIESFVMG